MNNIWHFLTPAQILKEAPFIASETDDRSQRLLIDAARYVTEFLTKPNAALGRPGAVCPFVTPALRHEAIKLAISSQSDANQETMISDMAHIIAQFAPEKDRASISELEMYRSFVIVYPYLPELDAADLIQSVQKVLKHSFVDRGLMVGEFFPKCQAPGLHSPAFHPLDTPFFSLAVRRMNAADAPFLLGSDCLVSAYLSRFGQDGEKRIRTLIEKNACPADRRQAISDMIDARRIYHVGSRSNHQATVKRVNFVASDRPVEVCPHVMKAVSSLHAA